MKGIWCVFKKEWREYFATPLGFVFLAITSLALHFYFLKLFFFQGQVSIRGLFDPMQVPILVAFPIPWAFLILGPPLTMRLFAEERRSGTIEVLSTLPITDAQIVIGKWLAATAFLALVLATTLDIPFMVSGLGKLDSGVVLANYVAGLLLASAVAAVGLFVSLFSTNQIMSLLLGYAILLPLAALGTPIFTFFSGGDTVLVRLLQEVSLFSHFQDISRGVLDLKDITYYLGLTVGFLSANILWLRMTR